MKLTTVIDSIDLRNRYKSLCLEFSTEKYGGMRPKKEDVLPIFQSLGFEVTYKASERFYLVSNRVGRYVVDYHFQLDGVACDIFIYIKAGDYWPLHNHLSFLNPIGYSIDEETNYTPIEKNIFCCDLEKLKIILKKSKLFLDDFLFAIAPFLEKDEIEFDIIC